MANSMGHETNSQCKEKSVNPTSHYHTDLSLIQEAMMKILSSSSQDFPTNDIEFILHCSIISKKDF